MDPRLLQFYIQELAHVRDTGAEFAARFPKVASRLAMDATEVQDPYVERLLDGFAFLRQIAFGWIRWARCIVC